ncbi:MAG: tetratricopeptide repeat protein [Sedimentisphaerales bacterium]|nr:tetratricopeptide repeat protein [Sedimentisphaerales bacterium]
MTAKSISAKSLCAARAAHLLAVAVGLGLAFCAGAFGAEPNATAEETRLALLLDEEVRLAEQLAKAFPQSEEPLVILSRVYVRRGDTDKAIEYWEKAVQMNPRRVDVYDQMAKVAVQMDEYEKAIELWSRVLQVDPNWQGTRNQMADAYMNLGQYERAIETLREEIERSGGDAESHFRLGQVCQHQQKYEEAKAHYERAVGLQSDHRDACYGLYMVCARLRLTEEAKRYLTRFQELKEEDKDALKRYDETLPSDLDCAYQSLAKLCFDTHMLHVYTGQTPVTADVLRAVGALGSDSPVYLKRLAELYASIQRVPEALTLYRRVAQLDPNDRQGQLNVGLLSVQMGLLGDAQKAFQRLIALDPNEYVGYQELARLYLRAKMNLPEARRLAQKAVDLEGSASAYYDLGLACYANGDATGGLAALKRAAELEPENSTYIDAYQLFQKRSRAQ